MTDHDHLFKELLSEFFPQFIDLFFPQVARYLDRTSIEFQPQEIFADIAEGDTYDADIVVKARFLNQDSYFIIHVEHQGIFRPIFDRRMFNYFAHLHRTHQLPVYPIVLFSHRSPRMEGNPEASPLESRTYTVEFPDWEVLRFNYRIIRLNHLKWQDYAQQSNPVASALMSKMKIRRQERPLVKLECLKMMAGLRLNPAQIEMLSGFVDTYLKLEGNEESVFQTELDKIEANQKGAVMEVVTSWMEKGIEQGIEQGAQRERSLILRQLNRRVGEIPAPTLEQIQALSLEQLESLGEALLDFTSIADLTQWLNNSGKGRSPSNS
ncbi:MAG: DUF4351 domain-containing protein [Oculatellaceae cyanobacterium Prado106]|jgi:predicted transposase YdaD|nr:DUF4351 domain-containing protein [Oculatellaceae cyanobacterium Prado106]